MSENKIDKKLRQKRPDKQLYSPPGPIVQKNSNEIKIENKKESDDVNYLKESFDKNNSEVKSNENLNKNSDKTKINLTNSKNNLDEVLEKNSNDNLEKNSNENVLEKDSNYLEKSFDKFLDKNKYLEDDKFLDKNKSLDKEKNTNITDKKIDKLSERFYTNLNFKEDKPKKLDLNKEFIENEEEYSHVLEAYDLSSELKTSDIRLSLNKIDPEQYEIRWVKTKNALIVFSSKDLAIEALKIQCFNFKLRKMNQACDESKFKARLCKGLPYKKRPETSAFLARRLVSSALGIRVNISNEQREAERKILADARERKKDRERKQKSAWDGTN